MRATAVAASALVLLLCACSDDDDNPRPGEIAASCGLPTPKRNLDRAIVPEIFLRDGEAVLTSAQRERGGFIAALNVPLSVTDAFAEYRTLAREAGYRVISEDNEIFEAEIYLRRQGEIGAIQIRRSICEDASIVFVNVIER